MNTSQELKKPTNKHRMNNRMLTEGLDQIEDKFYSMQETMKTAAPLFG
jgi:hypothetical protein